MNQAGKQSSLSSEQVHTLESTYTALHAIVVYLESHQPYVIEEDQAAIQRLLDFAVLCISRLVEHFAEVKAWEEKARKS